jgi:hypothetical protein
MDLETRAQASLDAARMVNLFHRPAEFRLRRTGTCRRMGSQDPRMLPVWNWRFTFTKSAEPRRK